MIAKALFKLTVLQPSWVEILYFFDAIEVTSNVTHLFDHHTVVEW